MYFEHTNQTEKKIVTTCTLDDGLDSVKLALTRRETPNGIPARTGEDFTLNYGEVTAQVYMSLCPDEVQMMIDCLQNWLNHYKQTLDTAHIDMVSPKPVVDPFTQAVEAPQSASSFEDYDVPLPHSKCLTGSQEAELEGPEIHLTAYQKSLAKFNNILEQMKESESFFYDRTYLTERFKEDN